MNVNRGLRTNNSNVPIYDLIEAMICGSNNTVLKHEGYNWFHGHLKLTRPTEM